MGERTWAPGDRWLVWAPTLQLTARELLAPVTDDSGSGPAQDELAGISGSPEMVHVNQVAEVAFRVINRSTGMLTAVNRQAEFPNIVCGRLIEAGLSGHQRAASLGSGQR